MLAEFRVFEIDAPFCLYSQEGLQFLEQLSRESGAADPHVSHFIVWLKCRSNDLTRDWLGELRGDLIFEELANRLTRVQEVLHQIASSRQPWIFVSSDDCIGSLWSLALSCSTRIWYNSLSFVGFPNPLYSFGKNSQKKHRGDSKDAMQLADLTSVKKAESDGLINLLCRCEGKEIHFANRWLARYRSHAVKQKFSGKSQLSKDELQRIALELLSEEHQAWVMRQISLPTISVDFSVTVPVCIDCNDHIPPASIIASLLLNDYRLVFFKNDPNSLAQILERIYVKLGASIPLQVLQGRWQKLVNWYVGRECDTKTAILLQCQVSDTLQLRWRGEAYRFICLSGNSFNANRGFLERELGPAVAIPRELTDVLNGAVASGITREQKHLGEATNSQWVRKKFLDEMIVRSRYSGCDLSRVAAALEAWGWGFAASRANWNRFLQTSELGGWKQASLLSSRSKRPAVSAREEDNATTVCYHLALFAAMVSHHLWQNACFASIGDSDVLVGEALGFPKELGTPNYFVEKWGRKRFNIYRRFFWPRFPTEGFHEL